MLGLVGNKGKSTIQLAMTLPFSFNMGAILRLILAIAFSLIISCTTTSIHDSDIDANTLDSDSESEVVWTSRFLNQDNIIPPVIPMDEVRRNIEYPEEALVNGIEGSVLLSLFIDENGTIQRIEVERHTAYGFAEAAISAMNGITCIPAKLDDKPVAVQIRFPIRFLLND